MDESLERAVRNLKEGRAVDDSAHCLVQHLRARLTSYFRRHNFSNADAEDLAQETFRRVFSGIRGLNDEARFRPWFFQIAYNVRLSARATTGRTRETSLGGPGAADPSPVDPNPDPLSATLQREAVSRTWHAVRRLPGRQKQCLVLRVVHEMSYEEIAKVLHLSIETVRTHLREARTNLRRSLKEASL